MWKQSGFRIASHSLRICIGLCFIAAAWLFLAGVPSAASEEESARDRFVKEYQPHAERLKQHYANSFVAYTFTYDDNVGVKQAITQVTGKYNARNYLVRGTTKWVEKATGKVVLQSAEDVDCLNDQYSFRVYNKSGQDYILKDLQTRDASHFVPFIFLCAPYADHQTGKTYLEIAQDPEVHVVALTDVQWHGRPMKMLECRFPPPRGRTNEGIRRYYFSPSDGWVCVGCSISTSTGISGNKEGQMERGAYEDIYFYEAELGESLPRFRRMEEWTRYTDSPKKSKCRKVTNITEYRHSPTLFDDADFRLSAFGLPEPMGVQPLPPSHNWLWLLAATIAAAALAILFSWLKRRRTMASLRSTPSS